QRQVTPFLPIDIVRRYGETIGAFDAGRGCPFQCSFCTIINVQGRKSRWRDADDVERLVRANLAQGVFRFFITDDNFARNRNWEAIFDRLIRMREEEGLGLQFIIQVDTLCHRIPNFVKKAARAGCKRVFVGLENINPDNLLSAKKKQNRVHEYRQMFLAWRAEGVITYAGYILGFPNDTPERIAQDIRTVQRELPVDLLEFFILTPLPGSADHKALDAGGVWMDPDMNKYDLEHVTTGHQTMNAADWQRVYRKAWDLYYSPEHIETILRRAKASGIKPVRLLNHVLQFYFTFLQENVHPLQGGYFRRKIRTSRRSGLPRESPVLFYPRRLFEIGATHIRLAAFYLRLHRIRRRVERDPRPYADPALRLDADAIAPPVRDKKPVAAAA
ncbi:MAG TPA: radical SAM protein, partial [Stellaceae bacterium]